MKVNIITLMMLVLKAWIAYCTDHGKIIITVDGTPMAYHLVALNESDGLVSLPDEFTIKLDHGPTDQGTRLWVSKDGEMNPKSYANFILLGKRLRYTLDLSDVHCSCNAALYWVSMPGYGEDGKPARGEKGNYYCDANKVWGSW